MLSFCLGQVFAAAISMISDPSLMTLESPVGYPDIYGPEINVMTPYVCAW